MELFFLFLPWLCECGSTLQRTSTLGDEGRRMLNVVALSSLRPLWFLSTIPLFLNTASPRQQGPATGFKVTFPAESSCLCFAFGSSWVSCHEPCLSLIVLSLVFIVSHFTGPLRSRSAFSWCVFYQSQFVCFLNTHTLSWTHMHTHTLTSRPSVPQPQHMLPIVSITSRSFLCESKNNKYFNIFKLALMLNHTFEASMSPAF